MPNFPIIDTHLHVWDQTQLKYSAFEGSPLFGHPYHVEDYQRDSGKLQIEAMVFLECYADFWDGGGQYIEEVEFVEERSRSAIRASRPSCRWRRSNGAARSSRSLPRCAKSTRSVQVASAASWSSTRTPDAR